MDKQSRDSRLQLVTKFVKEMEFEKLLDGIHNCVYRCVTVDDPVIGRAMPNHLVLYFDIALADQYGKHSGQSQHYAVAYYLPDWPLGQCTAVHSWWIPEVKSMANRMVAALEKCIREGKSVKLVDETKVNNE